MHKYRVILAPEAVPSTDIIDVTDTGALRCPFRIGQRIYAKDRSYHDNDATAVGDKYHQYLSALLHLSRSQIIEALEAAAEQYLNQGHITFLVSDPSHPAPAVVTSLIEKALEQ